MPGKQARNNEPPLSRAQSQIAAKILREEFDPSQNTHFQPDTKPRLLAAVNAAFASHEPPLPANYSFRKMEDWRANCVYRYKCREQKKKPESWETDGRKRYRTSATTATPPKPSGAQPTIKKRSPKTPPNSHFSRTLGFDISVDADASTPPMAEQHQHQQQEQEQMEGGFGPAASGDSSQVLGDTTNDGYPAETVLTLDDPCGGLYGLDAPAIVDPVWMAPSPQAVAHTNTGEISFSALQASGGWS
jgi:hypothetical protein